jgi:hypothetical protein
MEWRCASAPLPSLLRRLQSLRAVLDAVSECFRRNDSLRNAMFQEVINTAGFKHIDSSDRAVTNCALAEARYSPTKIGIRATAAAVPNQRTNRNEELAALRPAADSYGVAHANIV